MHTLCYIYAAHGLIPIIGIKVWVYAFLNLETRTAYIKIFKLVFKVLGNTAWLSIQFTYIYGVKLHTVTVNIYKK
jgi:hypothetical protein